ncbi:monocarboxylate transporter 9-like [Stegodyphus dumicola]|uniref:monocarboxylate transporter 9-like n=1 Tax=Stegodyphus dumicola TaxID=202533 RepID=UPI0015AD0172|nr:monocarboxylate transporter 9-like [Stegodyphus dumicola]
MENTPAVVERKREPLYSWCIAFACFWLSFLTVGLHRSAGVIYVSVIHVFNISREQATWPFSLCGSLMCLLGPLAGFLTHYFSIRSILVSGVLVSAVAIAACFFTPSLMYLIIFFGLFRGIGNGLVVTLNPVLIHQHFKHRKATATGIAYAGASVGSFALPPLIEYLLAAYGFKGCFLILGAIILNGLIPAFMARDPPAPTQAAIASKKTIGGKLALLEPKVGIGANHASTESTAVDDVSPTEPLVVKNETTGDVSTHQIILIPNTNEHVDGNDTEHQCKSPNGTQQNGDYRLLCNNTEAPSSPARCPVLGTATPITLFQKMKQREDGVFGQFRHTAQILTNPVYLAICITFGCNVVNFIAYLTVIVDFARDRGIDEPDAVFLVSAFSVGDLFGAVCLGWISDFKCLKRKYTVMFCFAAMGSLLLVLPMCETHALFLAVSVCMGVFNGCVMTNVPVVMREYLGLERLAVAVGLGHFFVGVGQLLFPMLIGYFRDNVGTYDHLFTTLGIMCLICSLMWVLEPLFKKLKP